MARGGVVGIIANPAAGKDVRRLVAHATTVSDAEKVSIVRRAALGAIESGAGRVVVLADAKGLAVRAVDGLDLPVEVLSVTATGRAVDTVNAARAMREIGCGAVVVLGGDGTNRNVAQGWLDVPVVPVSTGTNNVFPRFVEATVAGAAAGLVASGAVAVDTVAAPAKVVHVEVHTDEGAVDDLALIDAVIVAGRFTGSRAVWDPSSLIAAVLACAEPDAVGLSAIGGLVRPCTRDQAGGVALRFAIDGPTSVRAPIAPGLYVDVSIADVADLDDGEPVLWRGPGVLALDGEREHVLQSGDHVRLTIRRDGPRVIDPQRALFEAADRRVFVRADDRREAHAS